MNDQNAGRVPVVLLVLDGWGYREEADGNAVMAARTPVFDRLWQRYPHTTLAASGEPVGLMAGQIGNSNVGHLNMGAGRIAFQDIVRINRMIRRGQLKDQPVVKRVLKRFEQPETRLHLIGLVSDGGVHSHLTHLEHLLSLVAEQKDGKGKSDGVFVHAFLDGRDVLPKSASGYLERLEQTMQRYGTGSIATLSGRYYAMDRDERWDRTELAYRALVAGEGYRAASAADGLRAAYRRSESDEFVKPTVIDTEGAVQPGDTVVFFNFRADRARQLTRALTEKAFTGFQRNPPRPDIYFCSMTEYDADFQLPVIVPPERLKHTVGEWVSQQGLKQLRLAETEKYAHVTFFFNGGDEDRYPGEARILVPSPKVATYDQTPAMSAPQVTGELTGALESGDYDLIVANYANADMVGHTGDFDAAVAAVEAVDEGMGRVAGVVEAMGARLLVVADHGNAEIMIDPETGDTVTAHTRQPVPCILVSGKHRGLNLRSGVLADVGPTVIDLLGLTLPPEMKRRPLYERQTKRSSP